MTKTKLEKTIPQTQAMFDNYGKLLVGEVARTHGLLLLRLS